MVECLSRAFTNLGEDIPANDLTELPVSRLSIRIIEGGDIVNPTDNLARPD